MKNKSTTEENLIKISDYEYINKKTNIKYKFKNMSPSQKEKVEDVWANVVANILYRADAQGGK